MPVVSFFNLKVWRALNVAGRVPTEIRFALLPCQYFVCAKCNLTKGPSDRTGTFLTNLCRSEKLGIRKPQTIATAQLILIGTVISLHRVKHILNADTNLWYVGWHDCSDCLTESLLTMSVIATCRCTSLDISVTVREREAMHRNP